MRFVLGCCFVLFSLELAAQEPREWTSGNGKYTVRAAVVDVDGESVRLKRVDSGKVIEVPLGKLSDADRSYLQSLESKADSPSERMRPDRAATKPAVDADASIIAETAPAPPTPGEVGIEILGDTQFRLVPFGTIAVPADGMFWRIESHDPPVFISEAKPQGEAVLLTVMPAVADAAQRQAMVKGHYNTLVQQLTDAGFLQLRGTRPDASAEPSDTVSYYLAGELPENGGSRHFLTELKFTDDFTYIFQATAPAQDRAEKLIAVKETFQARGSHPRAQVPQKVVVEVQKRINEMVVLLESGDSEAILKELMPANVYQSLRSDEAKWSAIVRRFEGEKLDRLKKVLASISWDHARYDAEEQSVVFATSPRSAEFKKVDGKWQIQN